MFDFQPMKSASLTSAHQHKHLLGICPEEPFLLSNFSTALSKTIMLSVGFTDGSFQNYSSVVTNITECRANSVRFVKTTKLLG